MTRMLGRLDPVFLGETVEERVASVEYQIEREAIYTNHLEAQAALVSTTDVTTAASAVATAASIDVAPDGSIGSCMFLTTQSVLTFMLLHQFLPMLLPLQ